MKKIIFLLAMCFTLSAISQTSITSSGTKLPTQTGNAGKYLKTDGSHLSWATVTAGLSGSLTTNYIPYAVSSTSLANSTIKYMPAGHLDMGMNGMAITTFGSFPIYGGYGNSFETGYVGATSDVSLGGHLVLAHSGFTQIGTDGNNAITYSGANGHLFSGGNLGIGTASPSAKLHVLSSGSTSATFNSKFENSSGENLLNIRNDNLITFGNSTSRGNIHYNYALGERFAMNFYENGINLNTIEYYSNHVDYYFDAHRFLNQSGTEIMRINPNGSVGIGTPIVSTDAVLSLESTNKGFLPPRMTTSQKNAISNPSIGLMVFDTDLGRPCFYNGSWVTM